MDNNLRFLKLVLEMFEALIRENGELKEALNRSEEKLSDYRNLERSFREPLVGALELAEEYKNNAREQAELIIEEALLKARSQLSEKE